jgi:hypothetical protein
MNIVLVRQVSDNAMRPFVLVKDLFHTLSSARDECNFSTAGEHLANERQPQPGRATGYRNFQTCQ